MPPPPAIPPRPAAPAAPLAPPWPAPPPAAPADPPSRPARPPAAPAVPAAPPAPPDPPVAPVAPVPEAPEEPPVLKDASPLLGCLLPFVSLELSQLNQLAAINKHPAPAHVLRMPATYIIPPLKISVGPAPPRVAAGSRRILSSRTARAHADAAHAEVHPARTFGRHAARGPERRGTERGKARPGHGNGAAGNAPRAGSGPASRAARRRAVSDAGIILAEGPSCARVAPRAHRRRSGVAAEARVGVAARCSRGGAEARVRARFGGRAATWRRPRRTLVRLPATRTDERERNGADSERSQERLRPVLHWSYPT